jgi:hypothetical protein
VAKHVRKKKVVGVKLPDNLAAGSVEPAARDEAGGSVTPRETLEELADFPDELFADTVYHAVVGVHPPLELVGVTDDIDLTAPLLPSWAAAVVDRCLSTFQWVGQAQADVDPYYMSLVQVASSATLCGGDGDGGVLDVVYRYVHWDSWSEGGVCLGRFVVVADGKVTYTDVGWGRSNIVDFSQWLKDGRTQCRSVVLTR